ncbi:MAG: hypothetical protein M3Z64_04370 [Verrucomicrobiota bacterium]|nr:hypothetical protein [Verrucomicrobiota bacterium]
MKVAALVTALYIVSASLAAADTYTVTNTDDSGPGSLRQAMTDAQRTRTWEAWLIE